MKKLIIESLCEDLLQTPIDIDQLSKDILHNCGHDASDLRREDIASIFHDSFNGDWHSVAFAFDEVLPHYLDKDLSNEEFIQAIFVSLFLAEATRHGEGDLWFSFSKILNLIYQNKDRVTSDFVMAFFTELLHGVDPRCGI